MALCGDVGAMALPSELIVHIFSFLSNRDKLRASAVCWRWRECLFYPALWTRLRLQISGSDETSKLEFVMRKFGSFVRELQLELTPGEQYVNLVSEESSSLGRVGQLSIPPVNDSELSPRWKDAVATYLDQVLIVFSHLRNNRHLQNLVLFGDVCVLDQEGQLDGSTLLQVCQGPTKVKEIQHFFMELLSNTCNLKWLTSSFMVGLVTPASLACLSNTSAESLQHLCILNHQLEPLITPPHLDRLSNLKSLAMDFCDFTSDLCHLLASPRRTPLHRLSLVLNGSALGKKSLDRTPSDNDWKSMVRVSANLRVYIMAQEVENADLIRILKPSLPLERLHLDSYNVLVSDAALELVTQQYNKTLTHLHLIRDDPVFPDFTDNRNEDPLVLMAWRCTRLAVLVIHGYILWAHNLVAIARLRGPGLRKLTISESSIDFDPLLSVCIEGDPLHHLVKEVSLGLCRVWKPCMDSALILIEPTLQFHHEVQAFSAGM